MDIRAILAGLAFALIWSSAFSSARIIVADAPPILSRSLRFLISGVIGIALARFLGNGAPPLFLGFAKMLYIWD
jgi:probable blue pigment (indigoidine) exporter